VNEKHLESWAIYEANVQAYRSNFLQSQSILIAVGAITLNKNSFLTIAIATIALIQMWYIWFRVILIRTRVVDYYKFDMQNEFDSQGNKTDLKNNKDFLRENDYISNKKNSNNIVIRSVVNQNMQCHKDWNRKEKFKNMRATRKKIDLYIPISLTIIWTFLVIYSFV